MSSLFWENDPSKLLLLVRARPQVTWQSLPVAWASYQFNARFPAQVTTSGDLFNKERKHQPRRSQQRGVSLALPGTRASCLRVPFGQQSLVLLPVVSLSLVVGCRSRPPPSVMQCSITLSCTPRVVTPTQHVRVAVRVEVVTTLHIRYDVVTVLRRQQPAHNNILHSNANHRSANEDDRRQRRGDENKNKRTNERTNERTIERSNELENDRGRVLYIIVRKCQYTVLNFSFTMSE